MNRNELPPGAWRLDPFTRIVRYVPIDLDAPRPDAFDDVDPALPPLPRSRLKPIKHGTEGGYKAHKRRGETPCTLCRYASNQAWQRRSQKRHEEGDPVRTCPSCGGSKGKNAKVCTRCHHSKRWTTKKEAA